MILSALVTLSSVSYEGKWSTTDGNSCCIPNCDSIDCENPKASCDFHPECYADYAKAGFPFAYLYDWPGTSDVGSLGIEDLSVGWFLADIAFYFVIFFSIGLLILKKVFSPLPNKV